MLPVVSAASARTGSPASKCHVTSSRCLLAGLAAMICAAIYVGCCHAFYGVERHDGRLEASGRVVCCDANVVAPQGLGDITQRLRAVIPVAHALNASLMLKSVESHHGYKVSDILHLGVCDPAQKIALNCSFTWHFDEYFALDLASKWCEDREAASESMQRVREALGDCPRVLYSLKDEYRVKQMDCHRGWVRSRLGIADPMVWVGSIGVHRRGGDVEQEVGTEVTSESYPWAQNDPLIMKGLQQLRVRGYRGIVRIATQTGNLTALENYYHEFAPKILNGGTVMEALDWLSHSQAMIVGPGGMSQIVVQVANPNLVLHYSNVIRNYSSRNYRDESLSEYVNE